MNKSIESTCLEERDPAEARPKKETPGKMPGAEIKNLTGRGSTNLTSFSGR
jgi:hypothetical protein